MTTTVSTPDPSASQLVAAGQRAVRAYIDSLPPDHPERIAWDQSMADLRDAIDDACDARGMTREEMRRWIDELTNPTEGGRPVTTIPPDLIKMSNRLVRAYLDSLPPDHPDRLVFREAMAKIGAPIPTEGDANP